MMILEDIGKHTKGEKMSKYNAFLDIVKERHDPKIHRDKIVCPYCNSKEVKNNGTFETLVGGYNNHLTTDCECKKCHKTFTLQVKELGRRNKYIAWYVSDDKKILKGIPGCFEYYVYTCSKCGGDVVREELDKATNKPVEWLSSGVDKNGVWEKHYKIIFKCKNCGVSVESENSEYDPKPPKEMTYEEKVEEAKRRAKMSEEFCRNWTVSEEIGTCIINDTIAGRLTYNDKETR